MHLTKYLRRIFVEKILKSVVLVAATHRRLGRAFDGISTRVVACLINKWRAKISQRRLYNVRDHPRAKGVHLKNLKKIVTQRTEIVIKFKKNILRTTLLGLCQGRISSHKTCFPLFYFNLKSIMAIVQLTET